MTSGVIVLVAIAACAFAFVPWMIDVFIKSKLATL